MPRTAKRKKTQPKKVYKKIYRECPFVKQGIEYIDYKDAEVLKRFTTYTTGKILPRKLTGVSAKHQRKLAKAIKQSREMGLLIFVPEK